jgi:P-type Cu+ transporter
MKEVTLKISGMRCKSCAILIEEELLEKVGKVLVSFEKGQAKIEFDPKEISEAQIRKAITSLGYKVEGKI